MSTAPCPAQFEGLTLDHVRFHVGNAASAAVELVDSYGFGLLANAPGQESGGREHSVALGFGTSTLILTEALVEEHPAEEYVQRHGDGVADIAFGVADAAEAFRQAVERGAAAITEPSSDGVFVTATIGGFGDVVHTLVQPVGEPDGSRLPGFQRPVSYRHEYSLSGLAGIDHFAVCLESGELKSTVDYYCTVLGFRAVFTERVTVGAQAMDSVAVQSASGAVTFTLLEPVTDAQPGQIDDFLKDHGGPGVQHIAFTAADIVLSVRQLRGRGVQFLDTPNAYYDQLPQRVDVRKHGVDNLREANILADEDHDGQLFQIFAASTHPRRTFFFELIERVGSRTFGSGNVHALYSAVEQERTAGTERAGR